MDEPQEPFADDPGSHESTAPESFLRAFGPNFLAFGIGLALAYFLKWETTDLVWSLWLTSLVVGYATILATAVGAGWVGVVITRQPEFDPSLRFVAILGGLGFGLFYVGFFSLHFCGFHAGHSVFLNSFFPVEGIPKDGFGNAFMNPLLLWKQVFQYLIVPYGAFLIPAFIVERKHLMAPFIGGSRIMSGGLEGIKKMKKKDANGLGAGMMRPYVNVIRMHILIFFFAACQFLKVDSFMIYIVVSTVYFFPWSDLRKFRQSRKPAEGE
ncbi:MAG: DUF6498-containing protein [Verrucomicrobiales bacterium]|nr:DUF6498-containing protein [Verrucomicrobiales bacterium]